MTELMQASRQFATRPADQRFVSLSDMLAKMSLNRVTSKTQDCSTRQLTAMPDPIDNRGLVLASPRGTLITPTHWSFGQLCAKAGAPAAYLRKLPSPMAADCLNYGLKLNGEPEDIALYMRRDGVESISAQAVTSQRYGRIYNDEVTRKVMQMVGDGTGRDSAWSVPGFFGKPLDEITNANTTLYAGDRDMFIFLADEQNKIEIPNRRDGATGLLSRGFFVWNSEVGASTFGIAAFLFDYVCCNRIVWGATQYSEINLRHTSGAPDRFIEQAAPVLQAYSQGSAKPVHEIIRLAQETRCDSNGTSVDDFLAKRFTAKMAKTLQAVSMAEEQHPIETLWDASCAVTAHAKSVVNQDERVQWERAGGELLQLAA